jgi:hypothetical protein
MVSKRNEALQKENSRQQSSIMKLQSAPSQEIFIVNEENCHLQNLIDQQKHEIAMIKVYLEEKNLQN